MADHSIQPRNVEADFRVEELFFSTTDLRGIIRNGNDVFARVAEYRYGELVGRPHNIIRHPEMPACVFQLLWDTIRQGRPIVAYVQNMTRSGAYYWVTALVTPSIDGYLSVRLKPSGTIFPSVKRLYGELREREIANIRSGMSRRESLEDSTNQLSQMLSAEGFRDYQEFMSSALRSELSSRDESIQFDFISSEYSHHKTLANQSLDPMRAIIVEGRSIFGHVMTLFRQIDDFIRLNQTLTDKAAFVLELTESFQMISMNAAVEAAKVGGRGDSLSVIADHLGSTSRDIARFVNEMRNRISELSPLLSQVSFSLAAARLQIEMFLVFCEEMASRSSAVETADQQLMQSHTPDMMRQLQSAFQVTFNEAVTGLHHLDKPLAELNDLCEDLRRTILTLLFSRLIGTIEATPLERDRNFNVIFEEIHRLIDDAKSQLVDLSRSIQDIHVRLAHIPPLTEECNAGWDRIIQIPITNAGPIATSASLMT